MFASLDREARRPGQFRVDAVNQDLNGPACKDGEAVVFVFVLNQDQASSDTRLLRVHAAAEVMRDRQIGKRGGLSHAY